MDHWDLVLLVVAGYLAVMALVRLMMRRRNDLVEELHTQAKSAKRPQKGRTSGRQRPQSAGRRDKAA